MIVQMTATEELTSIEQGREEKRTNCAPERTSE